MKIGLEVLCCKNNISQFNQIKDIFLNMLNWDVSIVKLKCSDIPINNDGSINKKISSIEYAGSFVNPDTIYISSDVHMLKVKKHFNLNNLTLNEFKILIISHELAHYVYEHILTEKEIRYYSVELKDFSTKYIETVDKTYSKYFEEQFCEYVATACAIHILDKSKCGMSCKEVMEFVKFGKTYTEYYHTSPNQNLKIIEPRAVTHKIGNIGSKVFVSNDKGFSSAFGFLWGDNEGFKLEQKNNGPWTFTIPEKFKSRAMKPCSIYTVENNKYVPIFDIGTTPIEFYSEKSIKVLTEEKYNTAIDAMSKNGIKVMFV